VGHPVTKTRGRARHKLEVTAGNASRLSIADLAGRRCFSLKSRREFAVVAMIIDLDLYLVSSPWARGSYLLNYLPHHLICMLIC
jgi:hypothetical protein